MLTVPARALELQSSLRAALINQAPLPMHLASPACSLPCQVLDEQLTDLLRCLPDNPAMHERVSRLAWGDASGPAPDLE